MAEEEAKPANPAGIGLIGFGMTTVLLSLVNAHALPHGGESVVIPLAMAFGGTIQIIAGILEFTCKNTFGMVAFLSYGAFWWWFALVLAFAENGIVSLEHAGITLGVALILWGVFTLYMWIGTFKLHKALFMIFLTLWITYFLLGIGLAAALPVLVSWGGYVGILCGVIAMYTSFAIVTNETFGKEVIPM